MKLIKLVFIVVLALLLNNSFLIAQEKKHNLGISAGLLTGGEFYVEEIDRDFDMSSGLMTHVFYDYFVAKYFSVGTYVSLSFPEIDFLEETASLTEIGLTLKPRLFIKDILIIKPGLNIGYRMISSKNIDQVGGALHGLGINFTTELQFNLHKTFKPFLDIGFITQPAGGNDKYTITFSPLLTIRLGIVFAL